MAWKIKEFLEALTSVSESTLVVYRRDTLAFINWCDENGINQPVDVTRRHLRLYLAWLQEQDYARKTIARKASSLRRYFKWAQHQKLLASDPTIDLQTRLGKGRLPRVLKNEELKRPRSGVRKIVYKMPEWIPARHKSPAPTGHESTKFWRP